jgi:hypothetical protein
MAESDPLYPPPSRKRSLAIAREMLRLVEAGEALLVPMFEFGGDDAPLPEVFAEVRLASANAPEWSLSLRSDQFPVA